MKQALQKIAKATRYVRIERNINQSHAALESGISLRTLQNIEAGKAVKSESLFGYLSYLDLFEPMISTLPDPDQLTPMEQLQVKPKRRQRASEKRKLAENASDGEYQFSWGDQK